MGDLIQAGGFSVWGIWVSSTVVSTWVMMAIVLALAAAARWLRPVALEMLVDALDDAFSEMMARPATPYLPFLGSLAVFIAAANVIGVVPLLTTPTRDINTPASLSLVVFLAVPYFTIREKGIVGYVRDLASPIFMLPLEIIGQLSRTLSLTLRLFGNIISTELIVAVVFTLVPLVLPLPLIGFSIFTGLLQAYIYTVLTAVYLATGLEGGTTYETEE
jgi:F-type H+-transporting ATPase subunit a